MRLENIKFKSDEQLITRRYKTELPCGLYADIWKRDGDLYSIYIESREAFAGEWRVYKYWHRVDPLTAQSILFWLFQPTTTKEMLHGSDA